MGGFRDFLFRGNLIQLAIAVVIGAAFADLIKAFTAGLITPLIGIFGGQPKFSELHFTINSSQFTYGAVIDAAITFFLTALVLYYAVVWPSNYIMDKFKKEEESSQRSCPECCSKIDKSAKRCPFCTSRFEAEVGKPVEAEEEVNGGGAAAGDGPAHV